MAPETKVRVGVRVRPLLPNEKAVGAENVLKYPGDSQLGLGERVFAFDHVFPPSISQAQLYALTTEQMLKSYLEGYNVTILAYGQTGSGKTYTMGSEAGLGLGLDQRGIADGPCVSQGLIPRFLEDLFKEVEARADKAMPSVKATFLEIYDEQVYDLCPEEEDCSTASTRTRQTLSVRDKGGVVFVNDLKEHDVRSRAGALDVLRRGTLNRTTAATLMNQVSSRSHAVFTVTLTQTLSSTSGDGGDGDAEADEGQVVSSKLTFVDLAGSERMNRTGAEGERLKEGITINRGLLALGKVINALTDESGKTVHVPYRDSKLTRLLQDALGGNSQTLFLACVSPAQNSTSETLSTLYYAKRARAIKNKPVKNTDSAKEELRCLRHVAHFLKSELLRQVVPESEGAKLEDLMERPEAKTFLEELGEKLSGHLRRVGLETADGVSMLTKPHGLATPGGMLCSPIKEGGGDGARRASMFSAGSPDSARGMPLSQRWQMADTEGGGGGVTLNFSGEGPAVTEGMAMQLLPGGDPEAEIELLEKLRDLERQEAQANKEAKQNEEELAVLDGELEHKEELLDRLKKTLVGYHEMRAQYELLVKELETKEHEKEELMLQLQEASAAEQRKDKGAMTAASQLREKLSAVERQLEKLKAQKKQQETTKRNLERQHAEYKSLEETVHKLKMARAQQQRKQREDAKKHLETVKRIRAEIATLKRSDMKLQKTVGKLQTEIKGQKAVLQRRDHCIQNLKQTLAKGQAHISRLLALQKTTRQRLGTDRCGRSQQAVQQQAERAQSVSMERIDAANYMLGQHINERLEEIETRRMLQQKTEEYQRLMDDARERKQNLERMKQEDDLEDSIRADEAQTEALDLQMSQCYMAVQELEARLVDFASGPAAADGAKGAAAADMESSALKAITELQPVEARTVVMGLVDGVVEASAKVKELDQAMSKAHCTQQSLRMEIRDLQDRLSEVGGQFDKRVLELKQKHNQDILTALRCHTRTAAAGPGTDGEGRQEVGEEREEDSDSISTQLNALLERNDELEGRVQLLSQQLDEKQEAIKRSTEDANKIKDEYNILKQTVLALRGPKTPDEQRAVASRVEELIRVWTQLGLEETQRERRAQQIATATSALCERLEGETKDLLHETQARIDQLRREAQALERVVRTTIVPQTTEICNVPLLTQLAGLEPAVKKGMETLRDVRARVLSMHSEATKLVSVLGDGQDVQASDPQLASLQGVATILEHTAFEGDHVDCEQLGKLTEGALGEKWMDQWEASLRALRMSKRERTVQLQDLISTTHAQVSRETSGWSAGETRLKALLGAVRAGLKTERIGKTTRAERLEDQVLEVVCAACVKGGATRAESLLESSNGPLTLSQAVPAARFVTVVVTECEEARAEVGEALLAIVKGLREVQGATRYELPLPSNPWLAETVPEGARPDGPSGEQAKAFVSQLRSSLSHLKRHTESVRSSVNGLKEELFSDSSDALSQWWKRVSSDRAITQRVSQIVADGTGALVKALSMVESRGDLEGWTTETLQQAKDVFQTITDSLHDLHVLEKQLELLEAREAATQRILQLHAELRAMDEEGRTFEKQNKQNPHRLRDRKANMADRLRTEEGWRSTHKRSYTRLHEKLKKELSDWEAREKESYDLSSLPGNYHATRLMHLDTSLSSRNASPTEGLRADSRVRTSSESTSPSMIMLSESGAAAPPALAPTPPAFVAKPMGTRPFDHIPQHTPDTPTTDVCGGAIFTPTMPAASPLTEAVHPALRNLKHGMESVNSVIKSACRSERTGRNAFSPQDDL